MSKKEITIISAFFDIGRGEMGYENLEQRSFEKYLDYFKGWARLKNNLIVYVQKGLGKKILKVREEFGLAKKTKVIEIDNIFSVEPELFARMKDVEKDRSFLDFRLFYSEISNDAKYNYIMLMKYFFLKDASEKYCTSGVLVWLDFGFNHGGQCYTKPEEFDFELKDNSIGDKVRLFALPGKDVKKISLIRSLQYQLEHIEGAPIECPAKECPALYKECIDAMDALLRIGCMDDDQQLLLMALRHNSNLFEVKTSFWFMPIKEYLGGEHLSVSEGFMEKMNNPHPSRAVLSRLRRMKWRIKGGKTSKEKFLSRQSEIIEEEWPRM